MEEESPDGRLAMAGNVKPRMNRGIQLYPRCVKCVNVLCKCVYRTKQSKLNSLLRDLFSDDY